MRETNVFYAGRILYQRPRDSFTQSWQHCFVGNRCVYAGQERRGTFLKQFDDASYVFHTPTTVILILTGDPIFLFVDALKQQQLRRLPQSLPLALIVYRPHSLRLKTTSRTKYLVRCMEANIAPRAHVIIRKTHTTKVTVFVVGLTAASTAALTRCPTYVHRYPYRFSAMKLPFCVLGKI